MKTFSSTHFGSLSGDLKIRLKENRLTREKQAYGKFTNTYIAHTHRSTQ